MYPVEDASCAHDCESIVGQALQVNRESGFAAVQIENRLCALDLDYSVQGWDRRYHVDVVAALPTGGARL